MSLLRVRCVTYCFNGFVCWVYTILIPLVTFQGTATQALETTPAARNESKLSHEGSIGKNAVAAVT